MVKRGGHHRNEHPEGARSHKRARVASSSAPTSNFAPGTSVYVGNLSYETSWQNLKDHMRQAGNVDDVRNTTQHRQINKQWREVQ
jgi:RNA recognition motif-containing protein